MVSYQYVGEQYTNAFNNDKYDKLGRLRSVGRAANYFLARQCLGGYGLCEKYYRRQGVHLQRVAQYCCYTPFTGPD